MLDTGIPRPSEGRLFSTRCSVRLSDTGPSGRVRLDAVARYLQDAAVDDVRETGWGVPEHFWVIRSVRFDVLAPPLRDTAFEIDTWSSGAGALAAGRRWSLVGDAGGRLEVDSVWIHLGPDQRPARMGDFGAYGVAGRGRTVSTKLTLPGPPGAARRVAWPLRATDLDALGHVNNAAYWQAVEDRCARDGVSLDAPHRARLDYRDPIDLDDAVELAVWSDGKAARYLAFVAADRVRAVASIESLAEEPRASVTQGRSRVT